MQNGKARQYVRAFLIFGEMKQLSFKAKIDIIGINPFVLIPDQVLAGVFEQAGKSKGAIPVIMTIDGHAFPQNLVKYAGEWRLYLNQPMRTAAGKEVGATAAFTLQYDPSDRSIPMHPLLAKALESNPVAKEKFETLAPSRQKEIVRYIASLKTEESVVRNIERTVGFLTGKERFVGRDPN